MQIARELKKVGGILANPTPKRGKKISRETMDLVNSFEIDELTCQMPGKKDCQCWK